MIICLLFFVGLHSVQAQIGTPHAFDFLNLPPSASITALGGIQATASADSSILSSAAWFTNPAANQPQLHQQLSVSYQPYYADVDFATLSYSRSIGKKGSWGGGVQYLNYGEIDSYDITGFPLGTFAAQEYAIYFNRSHQSGPFRFGINAKWIASNLGSYGASALLFDVGGMFIHPKHDFTAGLTINNLGLLLNDYTSLSQSRMPTDLKIGLAYKPQYMPLRFYLNAYRLIKHYGAYYIADNNEKPGYVNKILRHMSLGGEILLSRSFHVLVGYNHSKRSTLQLNQLSGGAGLSLGFTLRLRFLQLEYARAFYHVAGGFNHFTLSMNLDKLNYKKN
ncbi:type IX secretion system protein PorQ [Catalinimonas niigatensis]|uniref:type IX secretion system protein PorQ n=1 Tax=Catalinimonas niigatensis TaxID=1397264 RepID=UPI0026662426|nr:type IX secretion system protein PorQ [Catalinimonas niigatensis]WPP49526.1 type IX secretion system protein PorQ [Catalinimonas niigatensis]